MDSRPQIERTYRGSRTLPLPDVLLLLLIAFLVAPANDDVAWHELPYIALGLAAGGFLLLDRYRAYTTVTAAGITVQGPLRTRHVPWSDVHTLRLAGDSVRTRWQARFPVYLYGTDGRSLRLPHVDERELDRPQAELDEVLAAAEALGVWAPREVTGVVARGERRRAAWTRAFRGAVIALAAVIAVSVLSLLLDGPEFTTGLIVPVPLAVLCVLFLVFDRVGESRAAQVS
ncbi:MAG TPA: PH domain-containing protein [Streptomyces sp.]